MKHLFVVIFFAFFSIFLFMAGSSKKTIENKPLIDKPDERLHSKCLYPIIHISTRQGGSCGTGVIVRSSKFSDDKWHNVFLTCQHVVNDLDEDYQVRCYEYENWSKIKNTVLYPCEFFARETEKDLTIGMFVSEKEMSTAQIDFDAQLYIGYNIFRIGCGLSDEPRLDYGKVTSVYSNLRILKNVMRTSVHTVPGDSGSPVFYQYKIIGFMQGIRVAHGYPVFGTSYAIPVSILKKWSDDNEKAFEFLWDNQEIPKMPFLRLDWESKYEVSK